jgi:nitrous oxide reductase accessory protein NosL
LFFFTLTLTFGTGTHSGERRSTSQDPEKWPVCGMFVAKIRTGVQRSSSRTDLSVFRRAKDMFKYILNLKQYHPSKTVGDIDSIYVTDYYDLTWIDGNEAFYVIGSDVYGPMGRELIPFKEEAGARGFLKDHKGKSILKFKEVTPEVVKTLDD